ncbi:MAG: S1C family serine protease [Gemmataceae bacterium]
MRYLLLAVIFLGTTASQSALRAADPIPTVSASVNEKLVKLFGAGGYRGVVNYGTGILVSSEGHILTVASQLLETSELIVHLSDGRKMRATVLATEPELDAALCKIIVDGKKPNEPNDLNLPHYNFAEAAGKPQAKPGDWVLAFSNTFEIAMRDEPMSIQRGVIAATTKLAGRRGIFDFPYHGDVYVVDAITNNPGAGGGALTDRKGNLLGIIGREMKNSLTDSWMNYSIPVSAKIEIKDGDKTTIVSLTDFVSKGMKGEYKAIKKPDVPLGLGGYHGIRFVPDVIERTPPYIEDLTPESPGAKAGLKPDDLVSFVDGEPIYSIKAFQDYIRKTKPGMTLRLEVRRGDNLQTIELKLGEIPK